MKSLMLLWQVLADELGEWCHTSTIRDQKTASDRYKHEGLSFLTITLPSFCKDFEKSLSTGKVDHDQFAGFPFTGGTPRFLGGFLDHVFDRTTGCLLGEANIDAIFAIRQLTLYFSKTNVRCSDARINRAYRSYIEIEEEVKKYDTQRSEDEMSSFRRMSLLLWGEVLDEVERMLNSDLAIPRHGPGKTADRLSGNRKFDQSEWPSRLEEVFPMDLFLIPNHGNYRDLGRVTLLSPGAERPVWVLAVPKTSKKPRIIAEEPTCMMYTQQALSMIITESIRHDDIMGRIIGFKQLDGQLLNRSLARQGSQTGKLATLDLSDASDRVSNQLVRALTAVHPAVFAGVQAVRSRKADVHGIQTVRLAKYASMGSALTFPLEAMIFLVIVFLGIQDERKHPLAKRDVISLLGKVRIYGDDIIVPVESVNHVIKRLQDFGLKVNLDKSHWTGKFRESCGGDYYDGNDVTVVRCRSVLPTRRGDAPEIISAVSLRNRLFLAGMWKSARYLDNLLERIIPFPAVLSTSPVLGRLSFLGYDTQKLSQDHQSPLVRGFVVKTTPPVSKLDGIGALMKFFLGKSLNPYILDEDDGDGFIFDNLPTVDKNHLERYGRPPVVDIKLVWAPSI